MLLKRTSLDRIRGAGALLQRHVWNLEDLTIKVRNEDVPPPILFSFGDSLIRPFKYDKATGCMRAAAKMLNGE